MIFFRKYTKILILYVIQKERGKNLFKFIKENIIKPFKDGIEEGKKELAEEEEKKRSENIEAYEKIQKISYNEKFALGIAAPFRVIIFGDWFTIFKDEEEKERYYPLHLYTFGTSNLLTEKNIKEIKSLLKRDFDIMDNQSAMNVLYSILKHISIEIKTETINNKMKMWLTNNESEVLSLEAFICCVSSYILTSCVDVGYIEKNDAIKILEDISKFAKEHFSSWKDFSDKFLLGEELAKINNKFGSKIIKKYIGYLNTKKGSPWNNIEWKIIK